MNIGKENEKLEFKKSTSELKESLKDIFAILNKHGKGSLFFGVLDDGTVWLTQKQMAELFNVSIDSISLHIKNIFNDKELGLSTVEESSVVQLEGN